MSEEQKYCVEFKVEYAHINPEYTKEWFKNTEAIDRSLLYLMINWNCDDDSDEKPKYQVSNEPISKQRIKEIITDLMKDWNNFVKEKEGIYLA
tara:strand:- start:303 stop:581 length:279 start_codon:yes stop_codon:yes gene_type:complete